MSPDAREVLLPRAASAARVPGVGRPNVEPTAVKDPHTLADLALLPAELGVAENAAVWVHGRVLPHRAVFVIADHLALVVRARDIVHHMHVAYERLAG
jgi:L-lactate dehydrogenase complex protein LldG